RLKTIRHPGIIRFIDGVVDESCVIYVTENVVPLKQVLMEMPGEEICMGLFNLIKTIEFLHSEMLSHNNIQLDSVFVTDSANGRRWVLGGMEYLTSLISELIQLKLLSPDSDTGHQDGTDLVDWTGLHAIADALASANPTERKRASEVVRSEWFEGNPIINVVENFLKEIRVVPVEVKKERFRHLPTELRALPLNTTISYVLPLVLTPEFASEPGAQGLYEQLFTPLHYVDGTDHHSEEPQGLLPIETYKETVLPFIVRLWRSRSYSARMLVLDLFECYFTHLLTQQPTNLESLLIPELILGLDEADDAVYLLSL
ncbi:uncharacterized protein EV422DRAFT_479493, partial [Fimicolochytrium jonesii]|uniref:uncharacterized protein n=1 Tax=Fimicolochytrium jonesii TaxID=1396493 RepID=UPI0022FE6DD3